MSKPKKRSFFHHHTVKQLLPFALLITLSLFTIISTTTYAQQQSGSTSRRGFFSGVSSLFSSVFGGKKGMNTTRSTSTTSTSNITSSVLDLTKLPLGDKKYSSSAKKGYVYSCNTSFTGGGANTAGFWIDQTTNTWDLTKKITVDGNVVWSNATWKVSADGTTRTLTGNGLPIYHNTGSYPIASTDDAYSYDRNPNAISAQTISFSLTANPTLLSTPGCVGGEVGIALSGVPIFNAFDAGGRDALAWEIQDICDGHPQSSGQYHYHGYSDCLKDTASSSSHSDLMGYAFDGFGIYGLKGENGKELQSADLDECHGHTHVIDWDEKSTSMYHYHFTRDFPYSVGCFRGQANVRQSASGGQGGMQGNQTEAQRTGTRQGTTTGTKPVGTPSGNGMPRLRMQQLY